MDPIFLTILFAQAVINILIINLWNSPELIKFHGVYQAEQKIHQGSIPRFGGLAMLMSILSINFFDLLPSIEIEYLNHILISLTTLIFVTFLEDIYNNILPQARLFFIFFSAFLLLMSSGLSLPVIDVPIAADFFIQYPVVLIILLTIAVAAMVNAFNLIDGANGLLLFSFISILGCLIMMAELVNDGYFIKLCQVLLGICIIQLLFNFPKARIFAGDLGAYSFGFIVTMLVIIFFGKHPEFLTWQAILILFYPACELLFTVIRRVQQNKNPIQADRLHLHQLIFTLLNVYLKKNILSNALTTTVLSPLWGFALLWILIFGAQLNLEWTCLGIGMNLVLYLFFYWIAWRLSKHVTS